MRRKSLISIVAALVLFTSAMNAQNEPTTTWPYVYKEFTEGEIYMARQHKMLQKVNIHLGHSKVHFLDKDIIKELNTMDVVAVIIGEDRYIPWQGSMYKVVASCEKGLILEQSLGDFAALQETGGAYGSSSTSSATMKLSSVDAASMLGQNHMMILKNKSEGKELPLITKYYVKTPDFFCRASKGELDRQFSANKDRWKAFLKTHKIKWNDPSSLAQITEYLETL